MLLNDSTEQSPKDLSDAISDRESEMKEDDKSIQEFYKDGVPS
jgi:hypothetical protein